MGSGIAPRRWVHQVCTALAKDVLTRTNELLHPCEYDLEVQRVAGLLGYQDPANFTRAFRQWTGQTPSQYRDARNRN